MTRRLYIDPGTRVLGAALFHGTELVMAQASRSRHRVLNERIADHVANLTCYRADRAVIEHMQYRPTASTPQDLIDVQAVGCAVGGVLAGAVSLVRPSTWKGNLPKPIHHARLVQALTPEEQERLGVELVDRARSRTTRGADKEVLDAVGIGLYLTGRINKSGGARCK